MPERPLLPGASLEGLPESGRLVVGYSGGADSTALTHWLMGQVPRERILLAHVNHMLRGAEADRDQAFAQAFAKSQGLAIQVLREDVAKLARDRGQGLEECGREVRYGFFHRLASGEQDRILTAHNADDNAETLLLNLCRGAALEGLCGIPRQRGKLLRPLLDVERKAVEAYCQAQGLAFVTDSSNFSDAFARNRVRHSILPVLRELNPRFIQGAGHTMALLGADREYLKSQTQALLARARNLWGLEASSLRAAPEALGRRALKLFLEEAGCGSLEKKHLDQAWAALAQGGRLDLPGGTVLTCAQGVLWAGRAALPEPYDFPVKLGENPLPGGKILVLEKKSRAELEKPEKIQNLLFKNALDCDIMTGTLRVRSRRAGDRFAPACRGLSKPLKQVLQELRVPAPLRSQVPLLAWGQELVWVQGAGAGERLRVREETRNVWTVAVRQG